MFVSHRELYARSNSSRKSSTSVSIRLRINSTSSSLFLNPLPNSLSLFVGYCGVGLLGDKLVSSFTGLGDNEEGLSIIGEGDVDGDNPFCAATAVSNANSRVHGRFITMISQCLGVTGLASARIIQQIPQPVNCPQFTSELSFSCGKLTYRIRQFPSVQADVLSGVRRSESLTYSIQIPALRTNTFSTASPNTLTSNSTSSFVWLTLATNLKLGSGTNCKYFLT